LATSNASKVEQNLLNLVHQLRKDPYKIIPKLEVNRTLKMIGFKNPIQLNDIYPFVLHGVDPKVF